MKFFNFLQSIKTLNDFFVHFSANTAAVSTPHSPPHDTNNSGGVGKLTHNFPQKYIPADTSNPKQPHTQTNSSTLISINDYN